MVNRGFLKNLVLVFLFSFLVCGHCRFYDHVHHACLRLQAPILSFLLQQLLQNTHRHEQVALLSFVKFQLVSSMTRIIILQAGCSFPGTTVCGHYRH